MASSGLRLIKTLLLACAVATGLPLRGAAAAAGFQRATENPDPALELARKIVSKAEGLFDAGHYPAALAEFTRAYETLEGHPRQYWVLHNLAVCYERLFHYDLALQLYEEYLRRAPATESDRGEVAAVLRTLRSLLATISVETSVTVEVWVDERRLGTTPGSWFVPAGIHTVELRAEGYESQRVEVRLAARQRRVLRPELRRLSVITGPSPNYFWVAAGASATSLAAGVTFGVLALRSHEDGNERAELHLDTSEQSERARKQALLADVCFGGAVVFGATATALYFLTDWSPQRMPQRSGSTAAARPVANVAIGARRSLGLTLEWKL